MKTGKLGLTLTEVTIQRQTSSVTVFVRGDGNIHYQLVAIRASQLALDFSDSISSLSFDTLQVEHRLLKEIRIEQNPQKLRLVFTLAARVKYAIKVRKSILAIQFKS
ncbi:AMIN domain-containing protein [Nitrospira sp. M1]